MDKQGPVKYIKTHYGRRILDIMKNNSESMSRIDEYTGEKETNGSVVKRSVRLAASLRKFGLQPGEVVVYCGLNHINIHIPYFAAMFEGLAICGMDPTFKTDEMCQHLAVTKPKLVFCDNDKLAMVTAATDSLHLDTKIVTFDGQYDMDKFISEYKADNDTVELYKTPELVPENAFCWLLSTSGSTGGYKAAAYTQATIYEFTDFALKNFTSDKNQSVLIFSPVHWLSAFWTPLLSACQSIVMVGSSGPYDINTIVKIINKYKPVWSGVMSLTIANGLINYPGECDLDGFKMMIIGGCKVPDDVILKLQEKTKSFVVQMYAQSETLGPVFLALPDKPLGSCGKKYDRFQVMLVNPENEIPIEEAHKTGELWLKGPMYTEYYNNPEDTSKAFSKDGWFKTGDLFYRDENNYYYFVERLKMVIKFINYHIFPTEIEDLIKSIDGVENVVVASIPDPEFGELPAACVVRKQGCQVTAQQIKDVVADKLSDAKRLRGGVMFIDEMPMTSTDKVARQKVIALLRSSHRE